MGDLISRQWMIDHCFFETDKELARNAPDADTNMVEVVRCKDCKYCNAGFSIPTCSFERGFSLIPYNINTYFCAHGTKRDGGNE